MALVLAPVLIDFPLGDPYDLKLRHARFDLCQDGVNGLLANRERLLHEGDFVVTLDNAQVNQCVVRFHQLDARKVTLEARVDW